MWLWFYPWQKNKKIGWIYLGCQTDCYDYRHISYFVLLWMHISNFVLFWMQKHSIEVCIGTAPVSVTSNITLKNRNGFSKGFHTYTEMVQHLLCSCLYSFIATSRFCSEKSGDSTCLFKFTKLHWNLDHTHKTLWIFNLSPKHSKDNVFVERICMHGLNVFYTLWQNFASIFLFSRQDIYGLSFWMLCRVCYTQ